MTQRPSVVTQPATQFRLVVAPGGALAAAVHADRAEVVSLPSMETMAEIGLEAAGEHDVAFAGQLDRLVVVSRVGAHARIHLVDPARCEKLAEAFFPTPLQIAAASGDFVLATSATTTALIDVSRRELLAAPLPTRSVIDAAAHFGAGRFLVSAGGLLEEWDARARAPTRRFRLARPLVARHVGGTAAGIWLIARAVLDQVSLATLTGGEMQQIELPEPVERIAAHPSGDVLAMTGARTGHLFLIDLIGRAVIPLERDAVADVAWCGASANLLIGSGDGPLEMLAVTLPVRPSPVGYATDEKEKPERAEPEPEELERQVEPPATPNTAQRLAAWRQRVRSDKPGEVATKPVRTAAPVAKASSGAWRDTLAAWARSTATGSIHEPPALDRGPLLELAERLELDGDVANGVALVYGAHLCGFDGIAAVDLSRAMSGRWEEALGGGRLASTGAMTWRRSRIRLARVVQTVLDELPPVTGTVVGGTAVRAKAVSALVVPAAIARADIGVWAAPQVGALLVPDDRAARQVRAFLLEALVRGVRPLLPEAWLEGAPPESSVVVVADATSAARLGAPVVATWSRSVPPEPNGSR